MALEMMDGSPEVLKEIPVVFQTNESRDHPAGVTFRVN
jgi:hypothetical protein